MRAISPDLLWRLVGMPDMAQRTPCSSFREVTSRKDSGSGFIVEELVLEAETAAIAQAIPATLCRPDGDGPYPAILYCHAHGDRYDIGRRELTEGRPALPCGPYGPVLAKTGYVVLCVDMPGFGDRQDQGSESALSKAAHWRGQTVFGRMLADLALALDALAARQDVDANRIAAMGISMGATHAYWMAALDDRITSVAHLCVFSNIAGLIASGAHDLHGAYMTVPGLLDHGDMADVAALVAPRPQLVAAGKTDPLTPHEALEPALATLRAAYEQAGAANNLDVVMSDEGHVETDDMRERVLSFLARSLRPDRDEKD